MLPQLFFSAAAAALFNVPHTHAHALDTRQRASKYMKERHERERDGIGGETHTYTPRRTGQAEPPRPPPPLSPPFAFSSALQAFRSKGTTRGEVTHANNKRTKRCAPKERLGMSVRWRGRGREGEEGSRWGIMKEGGGEGHTTAAADKAHLLPLLHSVSLCCFSVTPATPSLPHKRKRGHRSQSQCTQANKEKDEAQWSQWQSGPRCLISRFPILSSATCHYLLAPPAHPSPYAQTRQQAHEQIQGADQCKRVGNA